MQESRVQSLSQEDALEEGMATHSSILAWEIPWIEESGGLQPMGSQEDSDRTKRWNNNKDYLKQHQKDVDVGTGVTSTKLQGLFLLKGRTQHITVATDDHSILRPQDHELRSEWCAVNLPEVHVLFHFELMSPQGQVHYQNIIALHFCS